MRGPGGIPPDPPPPQHPPSAGAVPRQGGRWRRPRSRRAAAALAMRGELQAAAAIPGGPGPGPGSGPGRHSVPPAARGGGVSHLSRVDGGRRGCVRGRRPGAQRRLRGPCSGGAEGGSAALRGAGDVPGEGSGEAQPRWREGLLERGWGTGGLCCCFALQQGSKGEGERRECPPATYIYTYIYIKQVQLKAVCWR